MADLKQARVSSLLAALADGVVFAAVNRLLTVGISITGISGAMPAGTGLSLAIGFMGAAYLAGLVLIVLARS